MKENKIILNGRKKYLQLYDILKDKSERLSQSLVTEKFDKHIEKMEVSTDEQFISVYNSKGDIVIMDGKDKQFLFDLNINEPINCLKFSHDSKRVYVGSQKGKVFIYDVNMRKVIDQLYDNGAL